MTLQEMIAAIQKSLGVTVDGKAGPETWSAIYKTIVKSEVPGEKADLDISPVDSRSEKSILTLDPKIQPLARTLVHKAAGVGITIKIISGLRTYEEQNALYAQGRTTPGKIITNARGGFSNHNFGIAFDIGIFEGNKYLGESPKYKTVGILGMDIGLEWGGSWKSIVDEPHFQLRPDWAKELTEKQMLAALRDRVGNGLPIYA
ncbi:MAG: M15 family peptidase [Syntrophaceae bacterium]|nr:M15 family peptidase [Syntrophaceae bacterium]